MPISRVSFDATLIGRAVVYSGSRAGAARRGTIVGVYASERMHFVVADDAGVLDDLEVGKGLIKIEPLVRS